MKRLPFFLFAAVLVLLLAVPAANAVTKPSFSEAVDQLIARGYPQRVDEHLAYMPGTNPQLGFYFGGTWSDDARARYLAQQMRAIGLTNVHLEAVPVDEYDFKSASVVVGTKTMIASTFAGAKPTGAAGLTGQVVYAHEGTAADFDALESGGVDVAGKIVLLDADPNNWWMNDPVSEATYRGAVAAIFTFGPTTAPYWTFADDLLASFDSNASATDVPMVYVSKLDGDWLRSQLAADDSGPTATVKLIAKVTPAAKGGRGYNVVGDVPGRSGDGTFVLMGAHHDAFFHSGTDDTSGCVENLLIAKAMVNSGYRPQHTVRFFFTTAEEYGMADSYNDWCIGAWWAITHTHPKWAGKIRAFLNSDHFIGDTRLTMQSPEMPVLLDSWAAAASDLLPYGYRVQNGYNTWMDTWTFEMTGVPVVTFKNKENNDTYHSNYMTPYLLDWPYLGGIAKFMFKVERKYNGSGVLPYNLAARMDDLAAAVVSEDLTDAGADADSVSRLTDAVTAAQAAATDWEARAASVPAGHVVDVNASLLKVWKKFNTKMTGLTPFQTTGYRHQQALLDVQSLNDAIEALQLVVPDTDAARAALLNVDWTYYGPMLSYEVYATLLTRLDPDYVHAAWGNQANPVWPLLDVMPQYDAIGDGTWDAATITQLAAMRDQDVQDLNARLDAMSAALEWISARLDTLE